MSNISESIILNEHGKGQTVQDPLNGVEMLELSSVR